MENYNDLIKQINKYDESLKEIFQNRFCVMEKILSIENQTNNSFVEKNNSFQSDKYNELINECNRFMNNIYSLDKIYKYKQLIKVNNEFEEKCSTEKKNIQTVCYQGLPFSYSESAAKALFDGKTLVSKKTFENVFKDVHEGISDIGIVPIENSTAGYINDVYDLLLRYDLYINYNYNKKIDHCIAGTVNSKIEDIEEVYSHPQAIMQCKEYIDKYNFRAVNEINTAVAAQKIYNMNKKSAACICSPEAATHYGLKIFETKINHEQNYTRFGAISKYLSADENHNRVSIVFQIPHKVGALDDVLSLFSYYNINLSSIYSRPDLISPWKYLFYLDFEGNILTSEIRSILFQLKEELPFIKILGSFQV